MNSQDREAGKRALEKLALQNTVNKVKELSADKMGTGSRKLSAIQAGVKRQEVLDFMLKIRDGVLTTCSFSFDGDNTSEAYVPLRILSAFERTEIMAEMRESGLIPEFDMAYELMLFSKLISRASSPTQNPLAANENAQPLFSPEELLHIMSMEQMLALGSAYSEFLQKYSPNIKVYTDEQIADIIDDISEALDNDPKQGLMTLKQIFRNLDSNAVHAALISSVKQSKEAKLLLDKLHSGI